MGAAMNNSETLEVGIAGSADFSRRVAAIINTAKLNARPHPALLADAWSMILTDRPHIVIFEVGIQHSDRTQSLLRKLLSQIRERYQNEIYVAVALNAPEKFAYGGDLLFENSVDLTPSGFVDTFIAIPPGGLPDIPSISEQIANVISLFRIEHSRRNEGKPALPPLGSPGWIQSLADPISRELWMRWMPRYASYTNENPIIIGETGTGKTSLSYALHHLSGRPGEFVTITPRDFSSSELVQAELFGAVSGAYTGAVDKWGLVKKAEKGTLFIDELQSIDKDLQGKLITFIENKSYRRVGSAESVEADVRFVFASNRTLYDMMKSDVLRDDFAYRLERVQLEVLPLKRRRLDISAGLAYGLAKLQRQRPQALPVYGVNSTAYRMLFSHSWPGNLRQLENNVAKLCEHADMHGTQTIDGNIVAKVFQSRLSGDTLTITDVVASAAERLSKHSLTNRVSSVQDSVEKFVEFVRVSALEATGGDVEKAAEMLEDDEKVLKIMSVSILAKKELGLKE
ncbi:MAG: sigma-54-dependent Fis family transcriptional regulator [Candidatus Dadabacteria bacterium]|nr:MAG: sigma-54-dependent Fis family transcriptional regulator [Candidatus Dadabacteria bacterium]